jgi:hypothetical protein
METNLSMREMFDREISNIERKIEISIDVIDAKAKELIQLRRDLNTKMKAKALFFNERIPIRKSKKKLKSISEEKAIQMQDENIKMFREKKE